MRIGLHGIKHAVDGIEAKQLAAGLAGRWQVVDIGAVLAVHKIEQLLLLLAPPWWRRSGGGCIAKQLLPGRAKDRVAAGAAGNELLVKLGNEAVGVAGFNHKAQVEVVGRLADLQDAALFEHLERRPDLVKNGANAQPNQADGGTVAENIDLAQARQAPRQVVEHVLIKNVGAGVEGHCNVGFGRGNLVDRQAHVAENAENCGQKADLLPHAHAFQRDERNGLALHNGLDLAAVLVHRARNSRAFYIRAVGLVHVNFDVVQYGGRQGGGVQRPGAHGSQFLGFAKADPAQQAGAGDAPWRG